MYLFQCEHYTSTSESISVDGIARETGTLMGALCVVALLLANVSANHTFIDICVCVISNN